MPDIDSSLRQLVRLRARGVCEYRGISESLTLAEHEIDHVIAVKHGGQTVADNLALSCSVCNRSKEATSHRSIPIQESLHRSFIRAWIVGVTTSSFATARSSASPLRAGSRFVYSK